MIKHAIMHGREDFLSVSYPDSAYNIPRVTQWYDKEVATIGTFVFHFGRNGFVKEIKDLRSKRRIIARIVPDDVLERIEALDEEIETLDNRIRALGRERQEVLAAAIPRARLVRREDL